MCIAHSDSKVYMYTVPPENKSENIHQQLEVTLEGQAT